MTSFRLAGCVCRRGAFRGFFLAGLLLGLFGVALRAEAAPRTKPAKPGSARGTPRNIAPSSEPSSSSRVSSPIWDLADAWPSQLPAAPPDLLLRREDERKSEALALFAHALLADDNADAEKALAAYRKTLEFDPGYAELAVKVAYELARRNDVSGGIQVLKDAIKAAPKEPLPFIYLSQLYSKHLKKPELALKYAEQALALAPENFLCHSALYELHVAAGQPGKAEQALERAAKTPSTDPRFWIQLGDLYTRLYLKDDGSSEPAELQKMSTVYRKAAELGKDDPVTLAKIGDYFVLSRQVKDAIPFYQGALQLKPGVRDATLDKVREKLARAYMINQQNDEAIALLEEMTTGDSLRFDTFELLGELYTKKGDLDKALANFEHSVLLDGSQWQNYVRLTEMLLRTKRFEKGAETMRTARTRFPDLPQVTFSLGIALSKAKKHTEAMTVFAEAQAEAQNNHEELLTSSFYLEYGAAAEQAGLTEKAAELLKRAIELDPQNAAEAYNYLGYMWVDRGENLDEAGELIRKAVQMEPDNAAFMDSLGWFYFKKGEHEKALVELLRAAETIKPPDAVIFDHIGDAYHALGKPAEALQYWQKALALERDNSKIADKIGALKQNVSSNKSAAEAATPPP